MPSTTSVSMSALASSSRSSARPGRIIGDYQVPFDFPRQHDLRYEPAFAELCGRISNDLKDAHA